VIVIVTGQIGNGGIELVPDVVTHGPFGGRVSEVLKMLLTL
jgi:hypothetical protein